MMDMMNMGMGSMNGMNSMGSMGNMGGGGMPPAAPYGYGYGYGGMMQDPSHYSAMQQAHGTAVNGFGGFNTTSLLSGILGFALNIFVLLLVIGLIVGTFVYLKRFFMDGSVASGFVAAKQRCAQCGYTLANDWYVCPKCGEAKFAAQAVTVQPVAPQAPQEKNEKPEKTK